MTGITLAQYRIDAELGRGSMGAAWRTDNVLLYTSNSDSSLWSVGIDGGQTEREIMVRPFDPGSRRFTGDETPAGLGEQSCWSVAVSGEGTAVIGAEADPRRRSLFWLSADGAVLEALAGPPVSIDESSAPRSAERMSISPDARWLATVVRTTSGSDVYLQDLKGGAPRRLTLTERAFHPTISPDGRWIYYAEQSDSVLVIMRKRADQSGGAEFTGVSGPWPDVSADGSRLLAMSEWWEPGRVFDLEASAMPSAGMPIPGTQDDREGAISPDGRFLATDGPEASWCAKSVAPPYSRWRSACPRSPVPGGRATVAISTSHPGFLCFGYPSPCRRYSTTVSLNGSRTTWVVYSGSICIRAASAYWSGGSRPARGTTPHPCASYSTGSRGFGR